MSCYLMLRHKDGRPGHPVFLERSFDKASGGENHRESPFHLFFTSYTRAPLVFLCRHKVLDFDYYELGAGEYLISDRIADILPQVRVDGLARIDVQLLSTRRAPITSRGYAIIRLREPLAAVDPDRSEFRPAVSDPRVQVCHHLALDPLRTKDHDLFRIRESGFGPHLFCSQRFKTLAEAQGAQLRFIPEAEAAQACAEYDALAPR